MWHMFNIHVPEAETFCNNYIVNDHSISESEDWLRRSSSRPRMSRVDFTSWSSASSCPLAPSSLCLVTVVGLSSFWAAALWVSTSSPSVSVGYDFFFFFFFLWCRQPATIAVTAGKNSRLPAINKNPVSIIINLMNYFLRHSMLHYVL